MRYISKKTGLFLLFVAVVLGAYFGTRAFGGFASVPPGFSDARLQGALIAETIVNLSNKTVSNLELINDLDRERKYRQALEETVKLIAQSKEMRDQAVALSNETQKMTVALSDIKSFEARQAALEAISSRLALISQLINYSASVGKLLETLQARFSGARAEHNVAELISQINAEVTAINSFDKQARQAMERFDSVTR